MNETMTLYKIMVLYMLKKGALTLTNSQITNFFIDKGYTDFFTLQEVIHSLLETELMTAETIHNSSRYHLTPLGEETLSYMNDKLSPGIIQDIVDYFKEKKIDLINELSVIADYGRTASGDYAVNFGIMEQGEKIVDLTLTAITEDQAEHMCDNWQKNSSEIYGYLMDQLLK